MEANIYYHTEGEAMERTDDNAHDWVGCIKTNSGIEFNIEYPQADMVDIHDVATALAMICRYNGQIPSFYSVAEHSVRVADWLIDNEYPELAFEGLMHDAAEAYVGDIVRPMKLMPEFAEVYNDLEQNVERVIGEKFGIILHPMNPIVKEADKAVYEWEVEHIRSGKQMGYGHLTALSRFMDKYEKLQVERKKAAWTRAYELVEEAFDVEDLPLGGKLIIDEEVQAMRNERGVIGYPGHVAPMDYAEPSVPFRNFSHSINVPAVSPVPMLTHNEFRKFDGTKGEVRVTNPITGGEKGSKIERFDLIPVYPLTVLAKHYGLGALKYDSNQWRKGYEYSLSYAALQRHLTAWWNGEDLDPEFGDSHLAAVAWHAFTLLQFEKDFPEMDDRFKSGT